MKWKLVTLICVTVRASYPAREYDKIRVLSVLLPERLTYSRVCQVAVSGSFIFFSFDVWVYIIKLDINNVLYWYLHVNNKRCW